MSFEELLRELTDSAELEIYILNNEGIAHMDMRGKVKSIRKIAERYEDYEVVEIYKRPYTKPEELEIFLEAA